MKKFAVLSVLVLTSVSLASGHLALSSVSSSTRSAQAFVDDPPPAPSECPLCGGNTTLHVRRMQVIETLQLDFAGEALRW
jgi:hypothetical protein